MFYKDFNDAAERVAQHAADMADDGDPDNMLATMRDITASTLLNGTSERIAEFSLTEFKLYPEITGRVRVRVDRGPSLDLKFKGHRGIHLINKELRRF